MIKKDESGKISVRIQRADFTRAIRAIAESNLFLAKALIEGQPSVNIINTTITDSETGIYVGSFSEIMEETSLSPTSPITSETPSS